jgi:hypothetical protein
VRQQEEWRGGRLPVARPQESSGPPWGLLVTGLVIAGLGLMAWQYLGPDLRRYLKIRSM